MGGGSTEIKPFHNILGMPVLQEGRPERDRVECGCKGHREGGLCWRTLRHLSCRLSCPRRHILRTNQGLSSEVRNGGEEMQCPNANIPVGTCALVIMACKLGLETPCKGRTEYLCVISVCALQVAQQNIFK